MIPQDKTIIEVVLSILEGKTKNETGRKSECTTLRGFGNISSSIQQPLGITQRLSKL